MIQISVQGRVPLNLRNAARDLDQRMAELLQEVGTSILSNSKLDFETKSRGGAGAGGVTWKPLSPKTLENRVRRRSPSRKIVEQRRKLADQIRQITEQIKRLRRSVRKGENFKRDAAKLSSQYARIEKLRQKRADLMAKHKTMFANEKGQIGVDTGLLRNSATPGFQGSDGKGGNVLRIEGSSVTVGYGRSYARYFDEKRPLLPDQVPQDWQADIDEIVNDWIDDVLRPVE